MLGIMKFFIGKSFLCKKTLCFFSTIPEIYYPVVNCQLNCSYIYPSIYVIFLFSINFFTFPNEVSKLNTFKLLENQKTQAVGPKTIKNFLIQQLKDDQIQMQKTKEVLKTL